MVETIGDGMGINVLQIANGYLDKGLYRQLFSHLEDKGVSSKIFVPVIKGYGKKSDEENVKVLECYNSLDRYLFFSKQRKSIKGVIDNYDISKIDIIHAHTLFSTGYSAYVIHKKYGVPYIVAVRNTDVNLFFEKLSLFRTIGTRIMMKASNIIFLSSAYKKKVIEKYVPEKNRPEILLKSEVIPNGINDYYLENIAHNEHELHNPIRIIHVGDINRNKNITTTLKALELLSSKGITIEYNLIGEIKNSEIGSQIKHKKFVKYLGKQPKEVVLDQLRKSDIFVMPSHHETFGLVYGEAMSQGLPVIYTKGQGFDGQFDDGQVGFAVDADNPNMIAECITKIVDNYEQISKNCLSGVGKFNWDLIAKKYLDMYLNIFSKKNQEWNSK